MSKKALRFTSDEYNYYVNWLINVVVGRLREADAIMGYKRAAVLNMARKLRKSLGVPRRTVWRGLLLEPEQVPADRRLGQIGTVESVSWSEDKDVACWFASKDTAMGAFIGRIRPRVTGWLAKAVLKPDEVLWHWSWQGRFPAPDGHGTVPLGLLAEHHPEVPAEQFEWALDTQQEVISKPLAREIELVPVEESDCAPDSELDRRLAFRGPLP